MQYRQVTRGADGKRIDLTKSIKMNVDATGRQVSRTEKTVNAYRVRYFGLFNTAGVDPGDCVGIVSWFAAQDGRWAPATISQYRAALRQAIEDCAGLETGDRESLFGRLNQGPSPRMKGPPRTSTRKRKSIPYHEFRLLVRTLYAGKHPDDGLCARLLAHNVKIFLRPVEWETADLGARYLLVQNAKATNDRAHGSDRRIDISDYGVNGVGDLSALLVTLSARAAAARGYSYLWARLASRIARVCKDIKIKRVCLYTTRHVGIANAKSWMSPQQIAAKAGHKTTATATAHYAKRRTGWGAEAERGACPSSQDVEKVVRSPKESREANLNARAKKRAEHEAEEEASFKM
jgi:hypothetical protein